MGIHPVSEEFGQSKGVVLLLWTSLETLRFFLESRLTKMTVDEYEAIVPYEQIDSKTHHSKQLHFKNHPMNKVELVASVQKSLGGEISKAETERAVNAVIEAIKLGVKKSKQVQLIGFGTFKIASRKARKGVNPKTGESIKIKASKTVKFVPGKAFKDLL
jgi:nucleoid DNA-binding protein